MHIASKTEKMRKIDEKTIFTPLWALKGPFKHLEILTRGSQLYVNCKFGKQNLQILVLACDGPSKNAFWGQKSLKKLQLRWKHPQYYRSLWGRLFHAPLLGSDA